MGHNPIYYKRLDALRFIAFLLVIWQHCFYQFFANYSTDITLQKIINAVTLTGGIGVHLFFVISGFLITHLMIMERDQTGKMNLFNFYIRRFLRIWPLYYLVMILGIFVLPHIFNTFHFNASIFKNLTFLNNFDNLGRQIPNIGITWSVAIEEQFYLFWPLFFIFFKSKRSLLIVAISTFICSTAFTIYFPKEAYFHTLSNIRFLMTGAIGAIIYSSHKELICHYFFKKNSFYFMSIVTLVLITTIILSHLSNAITLLSFIVIPISILIIVIQSINSVTISDNRSKISIFSLLGKYTYGMYLYHYIIIVFLKMVFDKIGLDYMNEIVVLVLLFVIALLLTIIISVISYKYIESPILKYKNRFSIVRTRT